MKTPVLVRILLPLLFFCAAAAFTGEASAEPVSVGSLKTKDKLVEIHAGEHGSLYTVKTLNGGLLARHLSLEVLSQQFPDLGTIVERGIADEASLYPNHSATPSTNSLNTGL